MPPPWQTGATDPGYPAVVDRTADAARPLAAQYGALRARRAADGGVDFEALLRVFYRGLLKPGDTAICEIYVSSARDTNWGEDRLGADVLPPGRWLPVRLPLNDCVNDIRVVWQDGTREDRRQVDTCRVVNMVFQ